ncbi:MAG: hypothetical protein ACI8RN_002659 [Glaciecola sp.]|jgi:hypothetical protein|uniref:hypothetical protein n=1 Tax=Congregibacter sp. TaxID=2744308 RepID=UPI0039E38828
MFSDDKGDDDGRVRTSTALRHVLVFQLKLTADALRDFLLSPLSILAFAIDVVRKPKAEKSLYLRLMVLGRRSDHMINLFDDHADSGELTIDRAVDEVEDILKAAKGDGLAGRNRAQARATRREHEETQADAEEADSATAAESSQGKR